jgi:hypothetical protein
MNSQHHATTQSLLNTSISKRSRVILSLADQMLRILLEEALNMAYGQQDLFGAWLKKNGFFHTGFLFRQFVFSALCSTYYVS